jgi:hypothetical protein
MVIDPFAKTLMIVGALIFVVGIAWQFGWIQTLRLGRLPGDIVVERENFKFYFPLATCLLISGVFMLVSWLFRRI